MKKDNIFIIAVIIWQFVTGLLLITLQEGALQVASLGVLYGLLPNHYLKGSLLILASVLATIYVIQNPINRITKVFLLLPQQFFLLLTALSSANYVIVQQYADGVVRGWPFIFVDQLAVFILASLYTITLPSLLTKDEA